jgi:membrane protease YdiL (CAAX protease family)
MTKLTAFLKRYQLIAYFVLTYAFSWALWIPLQPLVLSGRIFLVPLISLGVFAPALVGIGLSGFLKPHPRQGSRKPARIAFLVVWILASAIMIVDRIVLQQMQPPTSWAVISVVTGLLPALIASSIFSRIPGVRALLRTYIRPRGAPGYYLLALVLFPAIWLLGNVVSRALGMEAPFSSYHTLDFGLLGMVVLCFLNNVIHGGLSEEPGWRGFALPRLQARFSPLVSSLILGIFWAVWHAPARFGGIEAKSLSDTLVEWVLILFVTIIFTWLFNRTKGSILATALLHAAMNTTGGFLNASLGTLALLLVFIIFIIVLDKMWRRLPGDSPAIYREDTQPA